MTEKLSKDLFVTCSIARMVMGGPLCTAHKVFYDELLAHRDCFASRVELAERALPFLRQRFEA